MDLKGVLARSPRQSAWRTSVARMCACVSLATGCFATGCAAQPGQAPLFPESGRGPTPGSIARLAGTCSGIRCAPPIDMVDGQQVQRTQGTFELSPGCHVVQLQTEVWEGLRPGWPHWLQPPLVIPIQMKAGHRYIIERDVLIGMASIEIAVSARDVDPLGASAPIWPPQPGHLVRACYDHEGQQTVAQNLSFYDP